MRALAVSVFFSVGLSSAALAQTTSWLGFSTNWHDPVNWSAGVPISSVDASITAGSLQPAISGTAACRSLNVGSGKVLTINGGARLDVRGVATAFASGAQVAGPGLLRMAAGSVYLWGRFANAEVLASSISLISGTTLSGTFTVTNGICTVGSGCEVGALTVGTLGAVNISATITASFVVNGNLSVLADALGTGSVSNASSLPLVVKGTSHTVSGNVSGPLQFEPAANARLTVDGTISGRTEITSLGPQFVIDGAGGSGNISGDIVGRGGEVILENLRCGDLDLASLTIWIRGTVTCGIMEFQHRVLLKGGPADILRATSLIAQSSSTCDGPEVPGQMYIRSGITIRSSNTFAPTRSVIRFEEPADNPAVPIVISVSDNPASYFGDVILANGVEVEFHCVHFSAPFGGYPTIDRLEVGTGCIARTFDWKVYDADVASNATFAMRDYAMLTSRVVLGEAVIRGTATVDAHVSLGDMTYPGNVLVDAGGTLNVVANYLQDPELTIDRSLVLRNGARLNLVQGQYPTKLAVTSTGRLTLDGTPASPAVIAGTNSPITLAGHIDARSFRISGMDSNGVVVPATATFGAAPFDFRGGHFMGGQSGGVLLDLTRSAAATLFELDFDNLASIRNIKTTAASAPITVVDSRGNRGGAAFEDDPAGRITWRSNTTSIANFTARPGINRSLLSIRTGFEETFAFRVVRLPSTPLAPFPATGPGFYNLIDDGLLAGTPYTYGLDRQRQSPFLEWVRIATTTTPVRPHAANEGVTRFVGPNGYASIAAALTAAPAGTVVAVEAGSYGGFTMNQPGRVIGDVNAPITITGPIVVQNINTPGADVAITGLTAQSTVTLSNVTVPVLLRLNLTSTTDPVLAVTGCPKVALERLTASRTTAITTSNVYAWNCAFNRVTLTQSSRFVYAGSTATSVTPDATSTAQRLTGTAPSVFAATLWPSGSQQTVTIAGTTGDAAVLLLSDGLDLFDLSAFLPFDMAVLLPLDRNYQLWSGTIGAGGVTSVSIPGAPPSLAGYSLVLQALTLNPTTLQGRFSEAVPFVNLR